MSEPKVIELTDDQLKNLPLGIDVVDSLLNHQDVLLKAPQTKLVHLSDLPDGVRTLFDESLCAYVSGSQLFTKKGANGFYFDVVSDEYVKDLKLIPGEWLPWQGGECPWPEGVEVEVRYRSESMQIIEAREQKSCWNWGHINQDNIIAHRCIGLLDGWKLVP